MNFKESFNLIVKEIERLIDYDDDKGYLNPEEIIRILQKQQGKSARELDLNFKFISGKSLNRYIKDRKMMATYKKMLHDEKYDAQSYIECAGYDNESSFSTAFSKKFGVPPKKAQSIKDKTKLDDPISIDSLTDQTNACSEANTLAEHIFGLPKNIIDRYNDIREYQAVYGLDDKFAELAVHLNEKKGIDLESSFKSVENLVMDYEDALLF